MVGAADKEVLGTVSDNIDSSADSNRLYTILLDTKNASSTESMYDIAESLLVGEGSNAKDALQQLWGLKKSLSSPQGIATVDLLINFYQEKVDLLRAREDRIRQIAKDSRELLEDKRKRDSELANVKQDLKNLRTQIEELEAKQKSLEIKEQELEIIDNQLSRELETNDSEVINGLYEIILAHGENGPMGMGQILSGEQISPKFADVDQPTKEIREESHSSNGEERVMIDREAVDANNSEEKDEENSSDPLERAAIGHVMIEQEASEDHTLTKSPFPVSSVKNKGGTIIAQYYFDPAMEERKYICNTRFFAEKLRKLLPTVSERATISELLVSARDIMRRTDDEEYHTSFENAMNEIFNSNTLLQFIEDLKERNTFEVTAFSSRLTSKLEAMHKNYYQFLREQMALL